MAALDEAIAWTNANKRRAAKLYMEMTKEKKLSEDDVVDRRARQASISPRCRRPSSSPSSCTASARFKTKPESWKNLYFAEAHAVGGD